MSVSEKERMEVLTQYKDLSAKADLYYAFQFIHVRTSTLTHPKTRTKSMVVIPSKYLYESPFARETSVVCRSCLTVLCIYVYGVVV